MISDFRKRRNLAQTEFVKKMPIGSYSSSGVFYTLMTLTALMTVALSADYDRTLYTIQRTTFLA